MRRTVLYAPMTKGEAQRSIRTFYEAVILVTGLPLWDWAPHFSGVFAKALMSWKNSPEKTISAWLRLSKSTAAASDVASMFLSSARLVSLSAAGTLAGARARQP